MKTQPAPYADGLVVVKVLADDGSEIFRKELTVTDIPKGNLTVEFKPDPMGPFDRLIGR